MSSDTWNKHTTSNRTRVLQDQYHAVFCMFSDAQWKRTPLNTTVSLQYQIHKTNAPRPTELKFYKISFMQESVCFQMHSKNTPHSTQLQVYDIRLLKPFEACSAEGARQTWLTNSQDHNLIFWNPHSRSAGIPHHAWQHGGRRDRTTRIQQCKIRTSWPWRMCRTRKFQGKCQLNEKNIGLLSSNSKESRPSKCFLKHHGGEHAFLFIQGSSIFAQISSGFVWHQPCMCIFFEGRGGLLFACHTSIYL